MKTHVLGVPRIGQQRELKFALEAFWSGQSSEAELLAVARDLRAKHQSIQSQAGLDFVAVGDFSLYDQMLDMSVTLGALPARFGFDAHALSLTDYFALARGNETQPAMEMTKWFNTNYHYLVPELSVNQTFSCQSERLIGEINETIGWGRTAKPVIIGPLTYLYLSKITEGQSPESACDCDGHTTLKHTQNDEDKLALLPALLNSYTELLQHIEQRGVSWVQIDEPILALDLPDIWLNAFGYAYQALSKTPLKLLLTTYFDSVSDHADLLARLPVSGIHIDLCAAPEQLETILQHHPRGRVLSLGVINGRNVWRADLGSLHAQLKPVYERLKHDLWLGSSCSLLHAPIDLRSENLLDSELHRRLSFAWQKIDEIVALKKSLTGHTALTSPLNRPKANEEIAQRIDKLSPADAKRRSPHNIRAEKQQEHLKLPLFPTTTIGSFPQTIEIRSARAAHKKGELPTAAYKQLMQSEIAQIIHEQEKLGLDVPYTAKPNATTWLSTSVSTSQVTPSHNMVGCKAIMDADVITIETSRSHMALLRDFEAFNYPNQIGSGVYDIHSPRVPTVQNITNLLDKALKVIPAEQLWVNPDCGLKTRGWPETRAALATMVTAVQTMRVEHTVNAE